MTQITTTKEFVVPIENKPGTLGEIAAALGKANVNITGFLAESAGEYSVVRFTTNEPSKTEGWLRSTNHAFRVNDVLVAPIPNNPGELGRIATALAKSGVNINAAYPSAVQNGTAVTLAVNDLPTAKKVLGH